MGYITSLMKSGLSSSLNSIKSYDVAGQVKDSLGSVGFSLPKIEVPEKFKDLKSNVDLGRIDTSLLFTDATKSVKTFAGMDTFLSPVTSMLAKGIDIPTEIGGVKLPTLPTLPDLSSATDGINEIMSSMNIDTNKLGIRSVSDILKAPDLTSLADVEFDYPVDLNNMPDLTKSLGDFDVDGVKDSFNTIEGEIPDLDGFDISKYF